MANNDEQITTDQKTDITTTNVSLDEKHKEKWHAPKLYKYDTKDSTLANLFASNYDGSGYS